MIAGGDIIQSCLVPPWALLWTGPGLRVECACDDDEDAGDGIDMCAWMDVCVVA